MYLLIKSALQLKSMKFQLSLEKKLMSQLSWLSFECMMKFVKKSLFCIIFQDFQNCQNFLCSSYFFRYSRSRCFDMNLTSKYPQRVEKLSVCSSKCEEYNFSVENDIKGAKRKKAPFHFKKSIFLRFNEKIPFFSSI